MWEVQSLFISLKQVRQLSHLFVINSDLSVSFFSSSVCDLNAFLLCLCVTLICKVLVTGTQSKGTAKLGSESLGVSQRTSEAKSCFLYPCLRCQTTMGMRSCKMVRTLWKLDLLCFLASLSQAGKFSSFSLESFTCPCPQSSGYNIWLNCHLKSSCMFHSLISH